MRKLLSLLLVALMVVPFGALAATGVSADADTVLYVKDGGTGDGSSAENALPSLDAANQIAATKTGNVTIKFVGAVTFDASGLADSTYIEPTRTAKVTWTGYDANSSLVIITGAAARYYYMGGELTIRDLAIETQGKVLALATQLYDITVDTGVTMTNATTPLDTVIIMGVDRGRNNVFYNEETNKDVANPNIVVKSGSFKQVIGYMANYNITAVTTGSKEAQRSLDGKVTITVSGNAFIDKLYAVCNSFNTCKDAELILDGGVIGTYMGATDRAYDNGKTSPRSMKNFGHLSGVTGNYTVYITENFDLAAQTTLTGLASNAFKGICGSTLNPDFAGALDDEGLGEFILKADASVFDAVNAEETKINKATFDKVEKVEAPVEPEPPVDPQPPVVEPDDPADNPDTGDAFVAIAMITLCATAAITVVVSKKRA